MRNKLRNIDGKRVEIEDKQFRMKKQVNAFTLRIAHND